MYYLYILKSLKDDGYYIGETENIIKRIKDHNSGKTKSIKHRIPFRLKYTEEFITKTECRKKEIFLKKNYQERKKLLISLGFDIK
jgi:putative endonuclease